MKCILGAAVAATGLMAVAAEERASVNPIQKVLQLMGDMKAKGIAMKDEEETKMAAFSRWCGDQSRNKNNEIGEGERRSEELTAAIEKATSTIRLLTARIQELDEDIARWKKDQGSATAVRQKESVDFKATQLDYGESIDAIGGAINVLKKQSFDRAQASAALLQVQRSRLVSVAKRSALHDFISQMPEAPEAHGYEFQSGGVVDMLEKLQDEFVAKKTDLEKEELTAQHGYEGIMQQLTDNIETASQEVSRKTKARAETEEAKAQATADLAQTTSDLNEDKTYLSDLQALCTQKASDFDARSKLRTEEIAAISKAMEIISSASVQGSGEKHLPASLLQRPALAQLRNSQQSPEQSQASSFLAERAAATGSRLLSEASELVAANPFVKVKKMIKDLIVKLMEEGTSETEHKGWCDSELATNTITRDERTSDVNELTASIEDLSAEIQQLTQDIADLSASVAELEKGMAKQTEDRNDSKATNEQTISESKEAQVAVEQATAVLKDYYAKAAQSTALVQQSPVEDAPESFDKPFQGQAAEGGGIVDFLEVILSDFARLESETSNAEQAESDAYDKFMFESKKDKALKEQESGNKSGTKTDRESALHTAQAELKTNQDQLDKANAYYDKLKPTCVDSGITYEDRVKGREAEIDSLTEALSILKGQNLPTLA
jgi:predicted  nucleic acid-binding Zn-ribbon protein